MSYFTQPTRSARSKTGIALTSKRGPIALTHWGKRWEQLFAQVDATRLSRGRSYARQSRVLSVTIHELHIKAKVVGSLPSPHVVTIDFTNPYTPAEWSTYCARLAEKSNYLAHFLEGTMPNDIDGIFDDPHNPLFPTSLDTGCTLTCTCYDWNPACKHALAVFSIITEMIDKNPLLIFQLRGKSLEDSIKTIKCLRDSQTKTLQTTPDQKLELFWHQEHGLQLPSLPDGLPPVNAYTLLGGAPWKLESNNIKVVLAPLYKHLSALAKKASKSNREL